MKVTKARVDTERAHPRCVETIVDRVVHFWNHSRQYGQLSREKSTVSLRPFWKATSRLDCCILDIVRLETAARYNTLPVAHCHTQHRLAAPWMCPSVRNYGHFFSFFFSGKCVSRHMTLFYHDKTMYQLFFCKIFRHPWPVVVSWPWQPWTSRDWGW